jgi:hypothetical protein
VNPDINTVLLMSKGSAVYTCSSCTDVFWADALTCFICDAGGKLVSTEEETHRTQRRFAIFTQVH